MSRDPRKDRARKKRMRRRQEEWENQAYWQRIEDRVDFEHERWLRETADKCRCCDICWEVPCGGCVQGSMCDDICNCDNFADFADCDEEFAGDWDEPTMGYR